MRFSKLPVAIKNVFKVGDSQSKPILHFQLDIFKRVVIACVSIIALLVIHFIFEGNSYTVWVLSSLALVFVLCFVLAKYKDASLGAALFLLSATIVVCMLMWQNDGLTDESILAFPALLIFAMLLSNFTLAGWLFLIMASNVLLIGLANEFGWYTNAVNESSLSTAIVVTLVLAMVCFSVYLASLSTHKLMLELAEENRKVVKSKKEIARLQNHDPLTGLPNRVLAEDFFGERLKIGLREGFETSLLFIDLDNFKKINDTFGHATGDQVLKTVATRLINVVRETDTVCRFGGDEFVVVALHECEEGRYLQSVLAAKLLTILREPIILSDKQVSLTVSIGIAVSPKDASDFEALYQMADLAMYATKQAGRNSYQYYSEDMNNDSARQLKIAQELRSAVANNELRLHYQSAQEFKTGKVVSCEALLRWTNPELGEVFPNEFIPVAEQSGSISDIGFWVLNEAVKTCKSWHDQGFAELSVAVNVSAIQFHRGHFEDKVKDVLIEHDLDGKYLILELTESLLFDVQNKLHDAIHAITDLGVQIAIDDFGTGYSNLGYLHKNDISILKIDMSFVRKILESPEDAAIVETIINISKSLGLIVVAEGVETEEVRAKLFDMGCTFGQGYFWSKPLSEVDFLTFIQN
ncbi:putative bifunctional diguanylate cyclase/phosphodiesterase [Glaciecola sp. SC05]|uniref:putative bifunctional diguanylate cyclase/phosphodiesterase n=1 Tax=Glaciecola sp. SC05 TaxID=1987355 RepID=UPI003527BCB7